MIFIKKENKKMKIEIKAHFGGWAEANFEKALRFFSLIQRPWIPEIFANHFRGVTYEELAAAKQRDDSGAESSSKTLP